jgi:hypothetical protein
MTFSFSERDLVALLEGEARDMKRYILDNQRDAITHNPRDLEMRQIIELMNVIGGDLR